MAKKQKNQSTRHIRVTKEAYELIEKQARENERTITVEASRMIKAASEKLPTAA